MNNQVLHINCHVELQSKLIFNVCDNTIKLSQQLDRVKPWIYVKKFSTDHS